MYVLIFAMILIIAGMASTGQWDLLLEIAVLIGGFLYYSYERIKAKLAVLSDRLASKLDVQKKQSTIKLMVILEFLIIGIIFLFSSNRFKTTYDILTNTPVGGLLCLFYSPADFLVGLSSSAWLMSGLQLMLVGFAANEFEQILKSKWKVILHTILFSFFAGTISSVMVTYVIQKVYLSITMWYSSAFILLKLIPGTLILGYYLIALMFFILNVKSFIDNIKALGVVTLFSFISWSAALRLLVLIQYNLGEAVNIFELNYVMENARNAHPFLVLLLLTLWLNLLYSVGIVLLGNAAGSVSRAYKNYNELSDIEEKKRAISYAKMTGMRRRLFESINADEVEKYKKILETTDASELKKEVERYNQRDALSREAFLDLVYKQNDHILTDIIFEDHRSKLLSKAQKKLLKQKIKAFCKKNVKTIQQLEYYLGEVKKTEFAYTRLSYPDNHMGFTKYIQERAILSYIAILPLTLFFYYSQLTLPLRIVDAFASMSIYFGIALLFYKIFKKEKMPPSFFDSRWCMPVLTISAVLAILTPALHGRLLQNVVYALIIAIMAPISVCLVFHEHRIRDKVRSLKWMMKKEIKAIYRYGEIQYESKDSMKKRYSAGAVNTMIVCVLREEEIRDYLVANGNRFRR